MTQDMKRLDGHSELRHYGDASEVRWRCQGELTESRRSHGYLRSLERGLLRYALMIVVMMILGVGEMWGSFEEGLYFIKSNSNTSFYLCPSIGCYYGNNVDQPHLTTFKTGGDQYSIWKIVPVENETDTYYLIHYKTGRYLKSNGDFTTTENGTVKHNRKAVHLEVKPETFTDDFKFLIKNSSSQYQIYPKSYYIDASGMSFNPTSEHKECYAPEDGGEGVKGMIGLYDKNNAFSKWQIQAVASASTPCATPIIKYEGDNIIISYPYGDETGITIYYTTDDTEPSTSGTRSSYSLPVSANGVVKVRAIATKTDFANSDEAVLWGSARPFLIESKECADYFLVPSVNGTNVNTISIPGTGMQWKFQDAGASTGGVQYYYVINSNNKIINYDSDYTLTLNDASADAKKFCVVENGYNTGKFFLIPVSQTDRVIYKNKGNVESNNCKVELNKKWNTNLDQWIFKVCNESADQKNLFSGSPFDVSSNNETHYYRIASVGASGYYIIPPTDIDGFSTTSNVSSDYTNNPWLFKVAEMDYWLTYYYIINAASGKYMYFNPNNNQTDNQSNVISLKDVSEKNAENEEKFQFIMVRSTTTGACYIVSKGYSYADASHRNFYGNKYFGLWFDDENPAALKTTWSRSSTANHVKWTFEEATITDLYLDPVISQDENGYVSITHPTVACDYYFTKDSSTPSLPANAETAPTAPTNKYAASFLPEVGVTQIVAKAVSKDVYTVSSDAVTYNLPEYTQPTITYDYENSTITISTDVGARIYYEYGSDPGNPTIDAGITTQTFTTDAISSKTVVKALAVKEGWAPSELITMTVHKPTIELSASTATYDKTDHSPTVTVKDGENVFDSGKYTVSYQKDGVTVSECKDAGTYTVVVTDVEGDNEIVCGATTFTITPITLTVTADANQSKEYGDPDPELTYTYDETAIVSGDVVADIRTGELGRASGETVGNYAINVGSLNFTNYSISFNSANFEITKKSLGSGSTPADNITCDISETDGNYSIVVKQGGNDLTLGTDYTKSGESNGAKYFEATVNGTGNYKDGFSVKLAKIKLSKLAGNSTPGGAALFVSDSGDGNFVVPDNMTAHIVTGISGNTLVTEQLNNIPDHVPVLLVSDIDANGFLVNTTTTGTAPTGTNMLAEVTDNPSKHFDTAEIYLLYKGEFVLNMAGDLAKGKIYMDRPSGPAPSRLFISWDGTSGIEDNSQFTIYNSQFTIHNSQLNEAWYTLDGRRFSGQPTQKGLYLRNGKKVVVK